MDLIIDAYGTYIGASGERIVLGLPAKPKPTDSKIKKKRRMQLEVSTDPARALLLAKSFVAAKCQNQITFLKFLMAKYAGDFDREIIQTETLLKAIDMLPVGEKSREQLLGIEGYIADKYWRAIGSLHRFPGRIPQGRDKFNSAANYGYGILYNEVERACLYVGLDPYIGLYHSERYGKPSLVLDLVEEFRVPIVDSGVIPLFIDKKIGKAGDFIEIAKGQYQLSAEGKAKVVKAVFDNLNKKVLWQKKRRLLFVCNVFVVFTKQYGEFRNPQSALA